MAKIIVSIAIGRPVSCND